MEGIAEAQRDLLSLLQGRVPAGAETRTCWGCGQAFPKVCLERAHIGPTSVVPDDGPENFWLLCGRCHRDQPDGASYAVQFRWLKSRESFWTLVAQDVQPLMRALREISNDREILKFVAWTRENPETYEALTLAATRPARAGFAAAYSNFLWSLLQTFLTWQALFRVEKHGASRSVGA
jgi:hypothetical protein